MHILHTFKETNILKFKITKISLATLKYSNKCSNCTEIQITKTTLHILPHPHAHTSIQTQNTQSPPHTPTDPPTLQVDKINSNWGQPSSTAQCVGQCTRANLAYTGQGTSVCLTMHQHAQGHPLTIDQKTKDNIVRMKQTVLEKGLAFV